jgi:hypothetical protein
LRIAGLPPVLQQALLAALPKAQETFRAGLGEAEPRAATLPPLPTTTQPATSVQMLVAMAAAEPVVERRRKIAERADKGLSLLEKLHVELVTRVSSPERMQELLDWSESFELPEDPQLATLARELELRVRVELAKYDRRV